MSGPGKNTWAKNPMSRWTAWCSSWDISRPHSTSTTPRNWATPGSKKFKPYAELQELYKGLDPGKAVIAYCHSGRRGSFGYFVLRLMGFTDVRLYELSWMEWGNKRLFYPVETAEQVFKDNASSATTATPATSGSGGKTLQKSGAAAQSGGDRGAKSGYVSCGG